MTPLDSLFDHWTVQTNTNTNTTPSLWICNSIIVAKVVWPPGSADQLLFNLTSTGIIDWQNKSQPSDILLSTQDNNVQCHYFHSEYSMACVFCTPLTSLRPGTGWSYRRKMFSVLWNKHLHMKKITLSFCIKMMYKHIYWSQQIWL